MSMNDLLSDMLSRLRNAQTAKHLSVDVKYSKLCENVLSVLKAEGYIANYTVTSSESSESVKNISVQLKYIDASPAIKELQGISKPGRRQYTNVADIPSCRNGLGVVILSTSKGVIPDAQARQLNVGGLLLCQVF